MEKPIFIRLDTQKQNAQLEQLQNLVNALKATNDAIIEFVDGNLTTEILTTIKEKGYQHYVDEVVKREELKLRTSKLANLTVTNMCAELRETLTEALNDAFAPLQGNYSTDFYKFIALHKNGNPYIVDTAIKDIAEMSSIYANTPAQIALHNKHLEAVKILNELIADYQTAIGLNVHPLNPLSTFFSVDGSYVKPKEIAYQFG